MTLTEQWKKGKLPDGLYWVKYKNGFIDIEEHITHHHGFSYDEKERIEEVLAELPSYDLWKCLNENMDSVMQTNKALAKWCEEFNALDVAKENTKLKELLKECRDKWVCYKPYDKDQLLKRIDKILANNKNKQIQ